MKKFGFDPFILLTGEGGDDNGATVIGGGSGNEGSDPIDASPCSYSYWLDNYATEDMDLMGDGYDPYDFGDWWRSAGFSQGDWEDLNPDLDWNEYVAGGD